MVQEVKRRPRTVLALDSDSLGRGDADLGRLLLANFLRTLAFSDEVPEAIVCYNAGVKLTAKGAATVELLSALEAKGAEIIICVTCLDYFKLREEVAVGSIGDMRQIVDALDGADKVLYL